ACIRQILFRFVDLSKEESGIPAAGGFIARHPAIDPGEDIKAEWLRFRVATNRIQHPRVIPVKVGIVWIALVEVLTDLKSLESVVLITIQNPHQPDHGFRAGVECIVGYLLQLLQAQLFITLPEKPKQ